MANAMGDPTPKYEGRLTLNPLKHLDWAGAVVLMASLLVSKGTLVIGWGKPVRYNAEAMRNPILHGGLVALAGPLSNFAMALCAGLPVKLGVLRGLPLIEDAFAIFAAVNLAMFVFNILPFPPLDGWKILQIFLPSGLAYKMKDLETRAGMAPLYVLMACMFFFGGSLIGPLYRLAVGIFVGRFPLS